MRKISIILSFVAFVTLFSSCGAEKITKSYNEGVNIIPQPQKMTVSEGSFKLKNSTKFAFKADAELQSIADYFSAKIAASTGYNLKADAGATTNAIQFVVDPAKVSSDEGYTLEVTPESIVITAGNSCGIFYGMQSVMQLLPAEIESQSVVRDVTWNIPAVSIEDEPRFKYRGMHLDVCRHFSGVDFVKKQIDVLAMLKINRLHWHLTEDQLWTIEIKQYPELTGEGSVRTEGEGTKHSGHFTQEEVKEIVAYATERYVDVIPEIELPGHGLAALKMFPQYSCTGGPFEIRNVWGVEPDVFCAGNDETFQFLENIISEVAPLFPSEYFHIGGDECPKIRWKECPKCQARMKAEGLKDEHELQSYFVQRIEKHVNKLGKKLIGWDEILEGGINPSATIMSWRGENGGIEAANAGHDVIMTPGNWLYLDHYQGAAEVEPISIGGYTPLSETYSYNPVPDKIDPEKAHHVIGVQANVWSEYMYTDSLKEYRMYPRVVALAEIAWTNLDQKDYTDFERRINNMNVRLDGHNINYHIPMPEGPVSDRIAFLESTTLDFNNTRNYPMVYTLDGTEPTATSTTYTESLVFSENATVKIATLLPQGKLSRTRTVSVEKETLSPAYTGDTKPGILKSSVDGYFRNSSAYANVAFSSPKEISDFSTYDNLAYKKPNVDIYEGYVEIPEDGVYYFVTDTEQLWIDGVLVVDNDDKVARHYNNKGTKALAKGKHSFKLIMNNSVMGGWPKSWNKNHFKFMKEGTGHYVESTKDVISY
ncbi:MAG: family 20 glycosylhydrolase [Rikenellaceae bacterium]